MYSTVVAEVLMDFKVMFVFCRLSFCVCFDTFLCLRYLSTSWTYSVSLFCLL